MFDKLQKIFKVKIKRKNVKVFLFFLLFSTAIWVLVQFSKVYTRTIEIPLVYQNEPLDKIILDENPKQIAVRMTENGFGILFYKIFKPSLNIDVQNSEQKNGKLYYSIEENREDILDQLDLNSAKNEILTDELVINFYQKSTKKVAVNPNISVEYAIGYGSSKEMEIEPDSIMVTGHKQVVDTLQFVTTIPLLIKDVKKSIKGLVPIDTTKFERISLYTEEISYFLKVEKFTEGKANIPIEIINVPAGVDISIFPQEAIITYQVNLDDYNKIGVNDFRVVCDFAEIDSDEIFLIPKIMAQPELVKNVRLNVKKVEFVIKK